MEPRTTTQQGESWPRSVFLLAFDLRKEKPANRRRLGCLLRAAALAELMTSGSLADESGKARAVTAPAAPGRLQAAVWEQIAGSPPRSWGSWMRKDHAQAYRLVRDELEAARLVRVERHRVLLFPVERVTPRKPHLSRRLAERVARAVHGSRPISRVSPDVRVLAALAAAARLKTVLPDREWPLHQRRVEQLSAPIEPITTALRKNLQATESSG
ncbi:GOLPH3/VPS74 family protein [Nonomuraea angiospora]|uniref:GOLPH3/VPS74 family protein n=1 Tax=Nonomuraea angiospora TaxID=46172 RepID=UPI0029B171CC|nr:GPP34 family phosphoprotein [Nonomuraea angiospora]MDX3108556.1 GPP34 family phosphoprotein [Nonomuraea angiospora]